MIDALKIGQTKRKEILWFQLKQNISAMDRKNDKPLHNKNNIGLEMNKNWTEKPISNIMVSIKTE